jgi:2-hydroxy-6-oxonona-2,4-dienedioate hydrolase
VSDVREIDTTLPVGELVSAGTEEIFVSRLGAGRPTVFLHGGGPGCSGWTDFGPVAELFATDREVLLFDMIQYGQSSKPVVHEPRWSYHARHIVSALDTLGIDQADFVCNSVGGSAALALASEYPERVRKVVATGSQPTVRGAVPLTPELGALGKGAWENYYGGEGPTWEKCREIMATLEWYDAARIPNATVDLRYVQSIDPGQLGLGGSWQNRGIPQDLEPQLGQVTAEVLLFWAKYDPFLATSYPLLLSDLIPKADIYIMDHASHHFEEEMPDAYTPVVKAFLG